MLLVFLPAADSQLAGAALKRLSANQRMFDDRRLCAFVVVRDPAMATNLRDMPGLRWFLDFEGRLSRLYDALDEDGAVLIVPRIFEPEMCQRLIAYYDTQGGSRSGVMRDADGRNHRGPGRLQAARGRNERR